MGGIHFGDATSSLGVGAHPPSMMHITLLKMQNESASKGQIEDGRVQQEML